jgi:uncharacterized protein (TIGR03382 family)
MVDLGVLPGDTSSGAEAVSGDGAVVIGQSNSPAGQRAFRWSSTGLQELGFLSGGTFSQALATNFDGTWVVGSADSAEGSNRAFIWNQWTGMVDLNEYLPRFGIELDGWTLWHATGISADGTVIAGNGTFNGEQRSWIVTGIPTPSSVSLMGLAVAWGARRRRSAH